MRSTLLACASVCLSIVSLPGLARAEATGSPSGLLPDALAPDRTGAPYFVVTDVDARLDPLPLREVAVHADISGVVADVTVTQLWENTGATPIDATYVFPLSTRAAVHALELRVGGRRIVATIKEKQEARAIYEEAKRSGQTATLLEQSRPNMFTTRVANIQPGDVIEVELSYVELLRPTDGVYSLVVPKVVGPRYVSPAEAFPDVPWSVIAPDDEQEDDQPAPTLHAWPVSVSLRGGVSVQWAHSSTHPLAIAKDEDGALEIELAQNAPDEVDATSDFVLDYALGGDALETGVLVQPDADGDGGHFLALIEPPERVEPALVPNREYVFIVDTSGSMQGWPLAMATTIVSALVADLDAKDRLNVLCFSGGAEQLSPLSLSATPGNKGRAREFLKRQRGQGGTEMLQALQVALRSPSTPGLARTFVVVTDGYVTVEAAAIDLIRERAGDANVFAIGVGDGVNHHLLEAIAHAGQGEPYVASDEAAARDIAERFIADARAPVLTDIAFSFDGFDAYDLEPKALPTLYAARPLLVSGRYHGKPGGALVVTGETGAGSWRQRTAIVGAEVHPAVPLLWARERIARLSDFAGAYDAPDNKAAVTALGLEYALVTQHTSFVAVDEQRVGARTPGTEGAAAADPVDLAQDPAPSGSLGAALQQGMGGVSSGESFVLGHGSGGLGFSGSGAGGSGSGVGRISGLGGVDSGGLGGAGGKLGVKGKSSIAMTFSVLSMPGRRAAGSVLSAVIKRRAAPLRACFLAGNALAAQTLVWELVADAAGNVTSATLQTGTLTPEVVTCAANTFRRMRFPVAQTVSRLRVEIGVRPTP